MGQEKRAAPRERNRREGRPSPSSDSAKLSYKRSANSALPARYRGVARDSNRSSFPVTSTTYPRSPVAEKNRKSRPLVTQNMIELEKP